MTRSVLFSQRNLIGDLKSVSIAPSGEEAESALIAVACQVTTRGQVSQAEPESALRTVYPKNQLKVQLSGQLQLHKH